MIYTKLMEDKKNNHNIPNLFLVGAPKCGTTSMHNWLSQHPEIFMSEPKEPLYFCTDHIREADAYQQKRSYVFKYRDAESYFSLFNEADNEKYVGESSTRYLSSLEAPQKIYEHNPKAKIIIMLRDPVDFMYSWHSEQLRQTTEDIDDFKKALQMEEKRKKQESMPSIVKCPFDIFYREWASFSRQINNYRRYFPDEQIKILLLEEIKQSPENIYTELLKFLQVEDTEFLPSFEIHNPHSSLKSKNINRFIENSKYIRRASQLLLPAKIRHGVTHIIKSKNQKKETRPPIPETTRKELMTRLKPEVEELANITNKDLISLWRYNNIK